MLPGSVLLRTDPVTPVPAPQRGGRNPEPFGHRAYRIAGVLGCEFRTVWHVLIVPGVPQRPPVWLWSSRVLLDRADGNLPAGTERER
ncbi:hypothetical protein GCM10027088_48310 [Nocardia goodfellowii]